MFYNWEFKNKDSEDFSGNRVKFKTLAIAMTSIIFSGANQYSCFVSLYFSGLNTLSFFKASPTLRREDYEQPSAPAQRVK